MEYYTKYFEEEKVTVSFSVYGDETNFDECHVMLFPENDGTDFGIQLNHIQSAITKLSWLPEFQGVVVVFKRYFLSDATNQYPILSEFESNNAGYAVSVVQQPPLNGNKVAVWVYMAKNMTILSKEKHSVAVRNQHRHIWTTQMHGNGFNSYQQTEEIFNKLEDVLLTEKCVMKDNCIRTWIYVNNVDLNYGGVVEARKSFFADRDMVPQTHYISSTGIEGRNYNPQSIVLIDSYSIQGLENNQVQYLKANSHLNPTYEYGVTFERGTSVQYGDRNHVFISGTASINNIGEIVYPNNVSRQIARTMENVEALLTEAGASSDDIAQMIVYLRDMADYNTVNNYFQFHYAEVPKVIVLAPVCRPGWLVEVECMAVCRKCNNLFPNF